MKCNCSLNNNYEVIGLCDIKDFNKKISQFSDQSWVQINIPETLYLSNNNPDIETVTKVNIGITITSSRPVNTPESELPNIEGLKLTGKILLVSGIICQNIIYIANNLRQSIHSVKFNIPFNTYIVIDKDTDIDNDKFCVYPCVENVFIRPLDTRSFTKSINLFLFAHRIEVPSCALKNDFVLNSCDTNEEVVRIGFDTCENVLVVESSGVTYNKGVAQVFKFDLLQPDGVTFKTSSRMNGNQNADNLANALNGEDFEIGDLIAVTFSDNDKLFLTNYPSQGQDYSMLDRSVQSFKITSNGIIEYILPNVITLYDTSDLPVLQIKLDILPEKVLINSTGRKTNPAFARQQYFKLTLLHSNGTSIKNQAFISGDEEGTAIQFQFFGQSFNINDVIKLEYLEANRVIISNFEGQIIYNPSGTEEKFRITKAGLTRFP